LARCRRGAPLAPLELHDDRYAIAGDGLGQVGRIGDLGNGGDGEAGIPAVAERGAAASEESAVLVGAASPGGSAVFGDRETYLRVAAGVVGKVADGVDGVVGEGDAGAGEGEIADR